MARREVVYTADRPSGINEEIGEVRPDESGYTSNERGCM